MGDGEVPPEPRRDCRSRLALGNHGWARVGAGDLM